MTTLASKNMLSLRFNFSELFIAIVTDQTGSTLALTNTATQPRGKVAAFASSQYYSGRRHCLTLSAVIVLTRLAVASACPSAGTLSRRSSPCLIKGHNLIRLNLLLPRNKQLFHIN